MQEQSIITFIDHIGRTMVGVLDTLDNEKLVVKNPAIIHAQPNPQGQLNVQLIPLFFREFVGEKNKTSGVTTWEFARKSIVLGLDVENDPKLTTQYNLIFQNGPAVVTPTQGSSPKVVRLFDDIN